MRLNGVRRVMQIGTKIEVVLFSIIYRIFYTNDFMYKNHNLKKNIILFYRHGHKKNPRSKTKIYTKKAE